MEEGLVGVGAGDLAVLAGADGGCDGDVAVSALGGEAALLAGDGLCLGVGVVGELEPFDGGGALLADVADDVRDGVGLVAEMAVGDVDDRHVAQTLAVACRRRLVQTSLHLRRYVCAAGKGARRGARLDVVTSDGLFILFLVGGALLGDVLKVLLVVVPVLDVLGELVLAESAHNVLHVVGLARDERAQVKNHSLCLVALAQDGRVGVLQLRELLLVALALALELLGNLLLQDKSLKGVITLLLCARQANSEARGVVLLLLDECRKTASFTLVVLDLGLEVGGLLRELLSEGLEFEELYCVSTWLIIR